MDNQFSPTPHNTQTTSAPDTSAAPAQQTTPPAPVSFDPPATAQAEPVTSNKPKKSKKKWLVVLLVLVLLAAVAGGVYYWQNQQVVDLQNQNAALTTKLNSAEQQVAQLTANADKAKAAAGAASAASASKTASTSDNIMTGDAAELAATTATLNGSYKPGTVTAVWVEYGTDPTALTNATPHKTDGLGAGDAKTYVDQAFKVTGLTAGTKHFYRVAATENGKTVYGGVASFTSLK